MLTISCVHKISPAPKTPVRACMHKHTSIWAFAVWPPFQTTQTHQEHNLGLVLSGLVLPFHFIKQSSSFGQGHNPLQRWFFFPTLLASPTIGRVQECPALLLPLNRGGGPLHFSACTDLPTACRGLPHRSEGLLTQTWTAPTFNVRRIAQSLSRTRSCGLNSSAAARLC